MVFYSIFLLKVLKNESKMKYNKYVKLYEWGVYYEKK